MINYKKYLITFICFFLMITLSNNLYAQEEYSQEEFTQEESTEEPVLNYERIYKKYKVSRNFIDNTELYLQRNEFFNVDEELFIPETSEEKAQYVSKYFDRETPILMSHIDIVQSVMEYKNKFFSNYEDVATLKITSLNKLSKNTLKGYGAYIGSNLIIIKEFFQPDIAKYVYSILFLAGNNRVATNYWFRNAAEAEPIETTLKNLNIIDLYDKNILLHPENNFSSKILYQEALMAQIKTEKQSQEQNTDDTTSADNTTSTDGTTSANNTTSTDGTTSANNTTSTEGTTSATNSTSSNSLQQLEARKKAQETRKRLQEEQAEKERIELLRKQRQILMAVLTPNEIKRLTKEKILYYIIEKDYIKMRNKLLIGLWQDINTGEIIEIRKSKEQPNRYLGYIQIGDTLLNNLKINSELDWINNDLKLSFNIKDSNGFYIDDEKMVNDIRIVSDFAKGFLMLQMPNNETKYYAPLFDNPMAEVSDHFYKYFIDNHVKVNQDDIQAHNAIPNKYNFILYSSIPISIFLLFLLL